MWTGDSGLFTIEGLIFDRVSKLVTCVRIYYTSMFTDGLTAPLRSPGPGAPVRKLGNRGVVGLTHKAVRCKEYNGGLWKDTLSAVESSWTDKGHRSHASEGCWSRDRQSKQPAVEVDKISSTGFFGID